MSQQHLVSTLTTQYPWYIYLCGHVIANSLMHMVKFLNAPISLVCNNRLAALFQSRKMMNYQVLSGVIQS